MRLRSWIAVVTSVILLIAVGIVGLVVNRSALQAADAVHRDDSRLLAFNNATLTSSLFQLSVEDLNRFVGLNLDTLSKGSPAARRKALDAFVAKTVYFQYGVTLTDANGAVVTSVSKGALPPATDPGYVPLRQSVAAGRTGFSRLMRVGSTYLQAVAVSIMVANVRLAVLTGYNRVAASQLQGYLSRLGDSTHLTTVVDTAGRVGFASTGADIGRSVDPAIVRTGAKATGPTFVKYREGGTAMIAVVAPVGSGWMYVRSQTHRSFDGAVHTRSQTINLLLLAMLLIGIIGIGVLGYRTVITRRRADQRF